MLKEKYPVLAQSERLYLTPLHLDHVPYFVKWFNDPGVFGYQRDMGYQTTPEEQMQWVLESQRNPTQRIFSIFYHPENQLIGDGGFINLDFENRKGEIGLVIGEKQYWDRGLGAESIFLLCQYGFEALKLHNIMAEHFSVNPKSLPLFQKLGFKLIGTRRQSHWLGGQMIDVHYSDLIPKELIEPTPR